MPVEVTREVVEALLLAAARAHPCEACGVLLGEDDRVTSFAPARNVHPLPQTHFEIDPQALIDAHRAARASRSSGGPQVLGYFHSHPRGRAAPSPEDARMAAGDGAIWAIAAAGELTLWRSEASGFSPLSYCLVNG
ncbi:MAG: peptidase [Erythrobacter sp. RIFCSPHIGHO2_12_FULL_63_10]|nr:MAG: peptidase [Erythrobacter sp. RIFCSPHIGHO2_12_FULL_63_10]